MLKLIFSTLLQAYFVILFISCLTACSQDNSKNMIYIHPGYFFPYQLSEPAQSWKLPAELAEISGLSCIDPDRLACVQDEKGIIYVFNLQSGEIESKIVFEEVGDYEGIEIVENDAWILKSNGTLFQVANYLKNEKPDVTKYPTDLSGKNDTEGLAYDPVNKNLLIACKEQPFIDEMTGKEQKAIYRFNLETSLMELKPFLLIDPDTIKYYKGGTGFKPSGIAIHPLTGDIYILGSAGKLLLIFSGKGEMLAMIKLNPMIFPQPEGICFSPDGILYISNEGGGRAGTILKFAP